MTRLGGEATREAARVRFVKLRSCSESRSFALRAQPGACDRAVPAGCQGLAGSEPSAASPPPSAAPRPTAAARVRPRPVAEMGPGEKPLLPFLSPPARELERARLRVSVLQAFRLEGHPQAKITVPDSSWVTVCKPGVSVWQFYDFEQYWRWEQGKGVGS